MSHTEGLEKIDFLMSNLSNKLQEIVISDKSDSEKQNLINQLKVIDCSIISREKKIVEQQYFKFQEKLGDELMEVYPEEDCCIICREWNVLRVKPIGWECVKSGRCNFSICIDCIKELFETYLPFEYRKKPCCPICRQGGDHIGLKHSRNIYKIDRLLNNKLDKVITRYEKGVKCVCGDYFDSLKEMYSHRRDCKYNVKYCSSCKKMHYKYMMTDSICFNCI